MNLYEDYSAQGFSLITAWPVTLEQMQTWLNSKGYAEYTDNYYDADSEILGIYVDEFTGDETIPTSYLIDRDGNVRHWEIGEINEAEWAGLIEELL